MRGRSSMAGNTSGGGSVADEAALWLATLTDSACTDDERQEFVGWLKRSNLHVDEFLRVSALTKRLTRPELWPQENIHALIEQALATPNVVTTLPGNERRENHVDRKPLTRRFGWPLAAAALSIIAALTLLIVRLDPLGLTGGTYSTAIGELRSITLEDGSVVELNTSSKVHTRFTPKERKVELLRGEAVFKVAKNPNRPFRVSAGSTQIIAVGTEFNVYARQTQTVVTVIEGRVRVTGTENVLSDHDLELTVGEQAVIAPHMPVARVKLADSRQAVSWTERRLIFEDTPLSEAADEFARYNPKHIRIQDPKLRNLKVSGVFSATDPASLVEFVEAYGNVRIQAEPDGWTLN